jgi:hypothetical protein
VTLSRWLPPLACAALFVALAPFVGELRHVLKESFGLRYLVWLAAFLALAGAAAFGVAVHRIREHRRQRYALLALAAALVAWQVAALGIGNAEVDVVERVHLLEFGLLGLLFERAFRPRHRNGLLPVLVLLAVGLCGLADEWVQWLTPARTGDARDVLLNLYAGGVGYLLGVALSSDRGRLRPPGPASRRLALGLFSLFTLAAAAFFDTAHLGHEIHDPVAGVFRSWRTPEELARAAEDRDRRWAVTGVPEPRPLAIEDTYWTEAGFYVGARDRAEARGDRVRAWRENRILERWYAPLLDHRPGTRWPEAQRINTEAEARARLGRRAHRVDRSPRFRSPTLADRIAVAPPRGLFWLGALLLGAIPGALSLGTVVRWPFGDGATKRPGRRPNDREVSR